MLTMQEEALFSSTNTMIETVNTELKYLLRYDTIWCLESSSEKTEGIVSKIFNTIIDIIKEIRDLIKKGLSYISNHVQYGLLSKKRKEEFLHFQELVKNNPSIKNKKVTVKDWIKINKEYDKVEKNIVKMMNDDTVDAKGLNMKAHVMIDSLISLTNSATAAVTVDTCLVIARKSPEMAKIVQECLNNCSKAVDNIEDQLGEREVKNLKNKVNKLTKESTGQKLLAMLYYKKEKSISDCLTEMYDTFKKISSGDASLTDKVKFGIEHRDLARTGAKAYVKNKGTRDGIKSVVGIKKNIENNKNLSNIGNTVKEFINPSLKK